MMQPDLRVQSAPPRGADDRAAARRGDPRASSVARDAAAIPVAVRGVVVRRRRVLLLKDLRGEWELPGGRLELRDAPDDSLARAIFDQTGLVAVVGRPLRPYVAGAAERAPVLILPFVCACGDFSSLRISPQHQDLASFEVPELHALELRAGDRDAIRDATDGDRGAVLRRDCEALRQLARPHRDRLDRRG